MNTTAHQTPFARCASSAGLPPGERSVSASEGASAHGSITRRDAAERAFNAAELRKSIQECLPARDFLTTRLLNHNWKASADSAAMYRRQIGANVPSLRRPPVLPVGHAALRNVLAYELSLRANIATGLHTMEVAQLMSPAFVMMPSSNPRFAAVAFDTEDAADEARSAYDAFLRRHGISREEAEVTAAHGRARVRAGDPHGMSRAAQGIGLRDQQAIEFGHHAYWARTFQHIDATDAPHLWCMTDFYATHGLVEPRTVGDLLAMVDFSKNARRALAISITGAMQFIDLQAYDAPHRRIVPPVDQLDMGQPFLAALSHDATAGHVITSAGLFTCDLQGPVERELRLRRVAGLPGEPITVASSNDRTQAVVMCVDDNRCPSACHVDLRAAVPVLRRLPIVWERVHSFCMAGDHHLVMWGSGDAQHVELTRTCYDLRGEQVDAFNIEASITPDLTTSMDGRWAVNAAPHSVVFLHLQARREFSVDVPNGAKLRRLSMASDGSRAAMALRWSREKERDATFVYALHDSGPAVASVVRHPGACDSCISPDGKWLVVASRQSLQIVDLQNLQAPPAHVRLPPGRRARPKQLTFSPDGRAFFISFGTGELFQFDFTPGIVSEH